MKFDSTKHPVSWFKDEYLRGALIIKPPFQRKPVWKARQKCRLIESMLMELPIPEIYLQQTTDAEGKTKYAVVDGQQRIRSVLQFVGAETDPAELEANDFVLEMLEPRSQWIGKRFRDLADNDRRAFYGYMFSVRYISTDSEAEIRDMFTRLNQFLTPLKPQELRNALYTGPFAVLSNRLADDEFWAACGIVTPASIRRMGDIEFVSELLIGVMHGPQSGSSSVIDGYYANYEDYDDEFPDERRITDRFVRTLSLIRATLPDIKGTRWANKTDFYTLFVACALMRGSRGEPSSSMRAKLQRRLVEFAKEVDLRLGDSSAKTSEGAVKYVRAVEKGANDKKRRGDRHGVLLDLIEPFFPAGKRKV